AATARCWPFSPARPRPTTLRWSRRSRARSRPGAERGGRETTRPALPGCLPIATIAADQPRCFPAYTGVPPMTFFARGVAALAFAAALAGMAGSALAQTKPALDSERDKVSYMIGMDVGRSIEAAGPDVDLKAFERALRNALEGGEPL